MKNLLLLLALLPWCGCIDTIDFTGEGGEPLLVIYGNLKTGELSSELTIRQTQPTSGPGENITDATVVLTNGAGVEAMMLPDAEGIYRFEPTADFPLTEGESYALEITMATGKTYVADPQIMPAPPVGATGGVDIVERGKAEIFARVDFNNISEPHYLRVIYDEVYSFPEITCSPFVGPKTCYFERELPALFMPLIDNNRGEIQDSVTLDIFEITDFSSLQGGFWGKHYYNLYLHSISSEAYEYWRKVSEISNAEGSIFDAPPAVIFGNIYEKGNPENRILGYFETSQVSVTRPFITLLDFADAGFTIAPYCPVGVQVSGLAFGTFDPACCNCIQLEGASYEKPDWF